MKTLNSVKVSNEAKQALEYVRDNGEKIKDEITGFLNPAIKKTRVSSILKNITQLVQDSKGSSALARVEQDQDTIMISITPLGLLWLERNSSTTNSEPLFTLELPQKVWAFILSGAAKEEFRAVFCHAGILENGDLFSTDGFRLHEVQTGLTIPNIQASQYGIKCLTIPKDAVSLMAKTKQSQILEFHGSSWRVGSSSFDLIDSSFPDYKRVIPSNFDTILENVNHFLESLGRLGTLDKAYRGANDRFELQTVTSYGSTLVETRAESDVMEFSEMSDPKATHHTQDMTLGFRLQQWLDAMKTLEVKTLKLGVNIPGILSGVVQGFPGFALINPLRS